MPVITIIVPVFNHWSYMQGFFDGMAQQTLSAEHWQLIVVDNGSKDIPESDSLPDFVCLVTCSTPGSYAARNAALKHARGDLILFTDADCRPVPEWLEIHRAAYLKNGDRTLNAGAVIVKRLVDGALNDYELYDSFFGIPQERYATRRGYAVTANLGIPRHAFDVIGEFDERRFSGGDAEFCRRATSAGFALQYISDAIVLHPARSTWAELATKARRVKGGQIRNGPFSRRIGFVFKSFLYPTVDVLRVLKADLPWPEKRRILSVTFRLAVVQLKEVFLLMLGKNPERR